MQWQNYFFERFQKLERLLKKDDVLLGNFSAEQSSFCRFNQGKVRQAGDVKQAYLTIQLVRGLKPVQFTCGMSGMAEADDDLLQSSLHKLEHVLQHTPEDPYFLMNRQVQNSERIRPDELGDATAHCAEVIERARGEDLVGIWTSGGIFRGFANSLGQRNWFESYPYNLDWSFFGSGDKAVKSTLSGYEWKAADLAAKMAEAKETLAILRQPAKTIAPGKYRAYLAPVALEEIFDVVCWNGFSLKAAKTCQSCLLPLDEGRQHLSKDVFLAEKPLEGASPNFDSYGFIKPDSVELIRAGRRGEFLANARSAKEYSAEPNGAFSQEAPESLVMNAGSVQRSHIFRDIGTGLYINNLWYLNFSDMPRGRITGMTRFATLWVENGRPVGPVNVMRFDESIFHILGSGLIGLTAERDFLMSASTYFERSTRTRMLPGALVEDLSLTL